MVKSTTIMAINKNHIKKRVSMIPLRAKSVRKWVHHAAAINFANHAVAIRVPANNRLA